MSSRGDDAIVNGSSKTQERGQTTFLRSRARKAGPAKASAVNGARPPRKKISTRVTFSIAVAAVAVAVAVVLVIVFLIMPTPMIGTYVTTDGRKLELHENGTARYGITYKNVWMATTYKWSRSGDSVKIVLPGVTGLQPGYKIRGADLVGNGGTWVKR